MSYAVYLLVATGALLLVGWVVASRGGLAVAMRWSADQPRRKAVLALAAGLVLVTMDAVGLLFFESATGGEDSSGGALLGMGWLVAWMSVWVLVTGSLRGPNLPSAARVVVLLLYIALGLVLTVMGGSWVGRVFADPPPARPTPPSASAMMDDIMRKGLKQFGRCYDDPTCAGAPRDQLSRKKADCAALGARGWRSTGGVCESLTPTESLPEP